MKIWCKKGKIKAVQGRNQYLSGPRQYHRRYYCINQHSCYNNTRSIRMNPLLIKCDSWNLSRSHTR